MNGKAPRCKRNPLKESRAFRGRTRALRTLLNALRVTVQHVPCLVFSAIHGSFRALRVRKVRCRTIMVIGNGSQSIAVGTITCVPLFRLTRDKSGAMDVALNAYLTRGTFCHEQRRRPINVEEIRATRLNRLFGMAPFDRAVRERPRDVMSSRRTFDGVDNVSRQLSLFPPGRMVLTFEICHLHVAFRYPFTRLPTLLTFNDIVIQRERPKHRPHRRATRAFRVNRPFITSVPDKAGLRLRVFLRLPFARVTRCQDDRLVRRPNPGFTIYRFLLFFLLNDRFLDKRRWGYRRRRPWMIAFSRSVVWIYFSVLRGCPVPNGFKNAVISGENGCQSLMPRGLEGRGGGPGVGPYCSKDRWDVYHCVYFFVGYADAETVRWTVVYSGRGSDPSGVLLVVLVSARSFF